MKKVWIIAGVVAVLLIGGVVVVKKMHYMYHGMHDGKMLTWMAEKVSKKLDLTDEQKTQLDGLVAKYQPIFREVHEKHREAGKKLAVEFKKDTFSRGQLDEMMKGEKKADIHKPAFDFLAEFHAILTPEQRAKAADHLREHMERHEERHE